MNFHIFQKDNSQKGQAALLVTMVLTSLIFYVAYFVTNIASKQTRVVIDVNNSVQAFYNADYGVEAVLFEATKSYTILGENPKTVTVSSTDPLSEAIPEYDVFITDNTSPKLVVKVRGYHRNTMRSIELSWSEF